MSIEMNFCRWISVAPGCFSLHKVSCDYDRITLVLAYCTYFWRCILTNVMYSDYRCIVNISRIWKRIRDACNHRRSVRVVRALRQSTSSSSSQASRWRATWRLGARSTRRLAKIAEDARTSNFEGYFPIAAISVSRSTRAYFNSRFFAQSCPRRILKH